MTKTQLDRAQEIQDELNHLEYSLLSVSGTKLFASHSTCGSRTADQFLVVLENETKAFAQSRITEKIDLLKAEFKKL